MSVALAPLLVFVASQVGTPGPANMVLMATGARFGLRRALPFVAGVALGKQFVIWPVGFGLMTLAARTPMVFEALKWASLAYILWLSWKIANLRLRPGAVSGPAPGFAAGLLVHPLNPKAWGMIITSFANFVTPGTPALHATAVIAICLLGVQVILHPLWTLAGEAIAHSVAGTAAERYLMWALAALTVASVIFVLFGRNLT